MKETHDHSKATPICCHLQLLLSPSNASSENSEPHYELDNQMTILNSNDTQILPIFGCHLRHSGRIIPCSEHNDTSILDQFAPDNTQTPINVDTRLMSVKIGEGSSN